MATSVGEDLKPVVPDPDGKKHKVTVFISPDHSIKEFTDFIMSATKSVDAYIPGEPPVNCNYAVYMSRSCTGIKYNCMIHHAWDGHACTIISACIDMSIDHITAAQNVYM